MAQTENERQSIIAIVYLLGLIMAMTGAGMIWGAGGSLLALGASFIAWAISSN